MRALRTLITLSLAGIALCSTGSPSSATTAQRYLPNCLGQLQLRPRVVYLACADGNFGVKQLAWVVWGGARAVGVGRAWANDCQPSCVAGHTHEYPAVLILTGSQRCPNGKLAYRKGHLRIHWTLAVPARGARYARPHTNSGLQGLSRVKAPARAPPCRPDRAMI